MGENVGRQKGACAYSSYVAPVFHPHPAPLRISSITINQMPKILLVEDDDLATWTRFSRKVSIDRDELLQAVTDRVRTAHVGK